ncbi:MAG: nitroreductase [Bacteroidota bacterium]
MAKIVVRKSGGKVVVSESKSAALLPIPQLDIQQVNYLIRSRRSVFPKQFSGEAVSREEIEALLENAHWAPNHGKTEPWFFKVFTGPSLKTLGEAQAKIYQEVTSEESFDQKKYDKLLNRPLACSHVIAICMKRGANPKIPVIEEIEAVAAAVQNMHLTATALGLGAYWSSGGVVYHDRMREWMGLGEEDKLLGFFMVGRPKDGWPRGKRNSAWQDKVEWVE